MQVAPFPEHHQVSLLACFAFVQPVQNILQHIILGVPPPEHGVYVVIPHILTFIFVYLTEQVKPLFGRYHALSNDSIRNVFRSCRDCRNQNAMVKLKTSEDLRRHQKPPPRRHCSDDFPNERVAHNSPFIGSSHHSAP